MSAKTTKRLEAESKLQAAILEAIKASGLDEADVKSVLERLVEVIEEEINA